MSRSIPTFALAAALALTATLAQAATPKAFLKTAMEGNNAEVAMGKMAQAKGASQGVKDFGRMLETDHAKAKGEDVALGQSMGVPSTDAIPAEAKAGAAKLEKLSGPAFDKAFAKAMIKDHKKDIAAYTMQAKGKDKTADLARATLPTLKQHLQAAEGLAK